MAHIGMVRRMKPMIYVSLWADTVACDRLASFIAAQRLTDLYLTIEPPRYGKKGEHRYDALEEMLALSPIIKVPTITMEGDANGAPHPESSAYAKKFSGKYEHRLVAGGIGHNLPQEAPMIFAKAISDLA
jgi:hypothetical protein